MEDIKKTSYNLALKRKNDDDTSSVNIDVPSVSWFDEDVVSSTPKLNLHQEVKSDNDISYSVLYSKELDESKLKEEEINLYQDLVMSEEFEKISKQKLENEVENLKKELQTLKDSDVKKSTRIEELTTENINLKKNICSLYRTVNSEIEHKDNLLAEANQKLDRILSRKNGQNFRSNRETKSQNPSFEESDSRSHKRKRSKSPQPSNCKKKLESSKSKTNNEKDVQFHKNGNILQINLSKSKERHSKEMQDNHQIQSNSKQLYQTLLLADNSNDLNENSDMFFNLLPDSIKKSFYEYERNQIVSLNKVKQSLVNEYFNSGANVESFIFNSTQNGPGNQLLLNNSFPRMSLNISPVLTSSSDQNTGTALTKTCDKRSFNGANHSRSVSRNDFVQTNSSIRTRNQMSTRSLQRDGMTLYSYRKQVSLKEKEKLELIKNEMNNGINSHS